MRCGDRARAAQNLFWGVLCLAIGAGIILHPAEAFASARRGLALWWSVVVPGLLPFLVVSELLFSLGVVAFLGELLDPAARLLFRLPGSCGFVLAAGLAAGFPLGAVLSARLYQAGLCTREEGERLASFTANASPLFLLGAVGVGMLGDAGLGLLLAAAHYASNLTCGLLLARAAPFPPPRGGGLWRSAWTRLASSSRLAAQGFGGLLAEAARSAATTLLTVGALIASFSVLAGVLRAAGLLEKLAAALAALFSACGLHPALVEAGLSGFFELTLGLDAACTSPAPLSQKLAAASAVLAWNGLAVQAQVAGALAAGGLRPYLYLRTRLLQVPLAVLFTCACASSRPGPAAILALLVLSALFPARLPRLFPRWCRRITIIR